MEKADGRELRNWRWIVTGGLGIVLVVVLDYVAFKNPESPLWPELAGWVLELLVLVFIIAALSFFWWPRRQAKEKLLKSLAILALLVMVLALGSYLPCPNGQTPVLAPVTWSLLLFVGEFDPSPFADGAMCPGGIPFGLELARFIAISVTFSAVVLATLRIWRQSFESALLTLRSNVDVVVGANAMSEPLIAALLRQSAESTQPEKGAYPWWRAWAHERRVVVIADTWEEGQAERLSDLGAIVIEGDPRSQGQLSRALLSKGRRAAHRVYLMEESTTLNREVALTAIDLLAESTTDAQPPDAPDFSIVSARIDDPREADSWRLEHARSVNKQAKIIVDAMCPIQMTAGLIVDFLEQQKVGQIATVGEGPLLAALMAEIVWQRGCAEVLKEEALPVKLSAWEAPTDVDNEWALLAGRLTPRARELAPLSWEIHERERMTAARLAAAFPGEGDSVIIFLAGHDPLVREKANRMTKLAPRSWVLAPDPDTNGLRSIHGRQFLYGGASVWLNSPTAPRSTARVPRARWEQLARLQHDAWGTGTPWETLAATVRWSNTAVTQQFIVGVRDLGYKWVGDGEQEDQALSDEDLQKLAKQEHARWKASLGPGWGYAEVRDPEAQRHPDYLDWDDPRLEKTDTHKTNRDLVLAQQERARLLGMHIIRADLLQTLAGEAAAGDAADHSAL